MSLIYPGLIRLIIHSPLDGRLNMAIDETLLESVSLHNSPPVIRLYGFKPPTLSVGRFQTAQADIDFSALKRDAVTFVRRPSGGKAVLHKDELTYAAVLGKDHLSSFGKRQVYKFVVTILLEGLREIGLNHVHSAQGRQGVNRNPDCFASTGEYEIDTLTGKKLIGSAQAISRTAVLQHGSLPLSEANREIAAYLKSFILSDDHSAHLSQELGRRLTFEEIETAFTAAISKLLKTEISELTDSENKQAYELLEQKFSRDSWNLKY
ncbi:MAG: biotin/lipoate A/B protein ligase family protein [Spirochaetota bacterium]